MAATEASYLIVGAGVFGAATALELKRANPLANVTLVDRTEFPNPSAASHDLNKIVRADYGDVMYMKLALEAQELWRNDPIYKPYYHQVGMLYAESKGMGKSFIANYKKLGIDYASEFMSTEEARTRFSGAFRAANWEGVTQTYFNPRSGWGDGAGALRSVIQAGVDIGVTYKAAPVSKLALDEADKCVGVTLEDGGELRADQVVLCVGAWTPFFLAESAPNSQQLQTGDRMVAAGAIQCCATFPEDQAYKFKDVPVVFNAMAHTEGESIPPTAENRLKFNYEASFTNKSYHESSRQTLSIPPRRTSRSTWSQDVPQGLKDEIKTVVKHTYGDWIEGLEIESYRMCWDAITPNQDFIISPHPHCQGLYVATGGSFHSWKFVPVLGRYVVQMLQGTLSDELAARWAWDRPADGGALPEFLPHRDLKDIPGYVG